MVGVAGCRHFAAVSWGGSRTPIDRAMNHQGMESVRLTGAGGTGPGARFLLAACGVVATGAYLGAEWLRQPFAGLPAGVWIIGIAYGAGYAWSLRTQGGRRAAFTPQNLPLAPGVPQAAGWAGLDIGLVGGRVAAASWEGARALASGLGGSGSRLDDMESRWAAAWDHRPVEPRGLRIGLCVGPDVLKTLRIPAPDIGVEVSWVNVRESAADGRALARMGLDAAVFQNSHGQVRVVTPESGSHEAAWYDWSSARPMTYASVFPMRMDPSRVTIEDLDAGDRAEADVLRAIVLAAATLSRSPGRLTLTDRLRGRGPWRASEDGTPAERAMVQLAAVLAASEDATPARRAAARAVSAFMAGTDAWVEMDERQRGTRAACRVLGHEPEVALRAAAVAVASGDDRESLEAVGRAAAAVRGDANRTEFDHLAFLQSELECGLASPMTLGRVAAGICLVCASAPPERVPFIRADFMDDVRYAAWLVGRDQDRAVLDSVFRAMELPGERLAA